MRCRNCGEEDFEVETRQGVEVWLDHLLPYQLACASKTPGCHDILTCQRCAERAKQMSILNVLPSLPEQQSMFEEPRQKWSDKG